METKIIQITAGRGPAECQWVVAKVLKAFLEECTASQIETTVLSKEKGFENRTLQSATIQLKGKRIEEFLNPWLGTIQWIGTSTFRKFHKRKNWFVALFQLSNFEQFKLEDKDIRYQATRSSGPGGQHVNKVSSAIRATHIPTNTQVLVMDSRSQHQNKKLAKQRLQEKLMTLQLEQLKNQAKSQWENHLNIQRGNPIKIFKGSDFKVQKTDKTFKKQRQQLKNDLRNKMGNDLSD